MTDKQTLEPPHSTDAERAVLGACIRFPESLDDVLPVIRTESAFYVPRHRTIFETIIEMHRRSEPVDLTTLGTELGKLNKLDQVGGRVYLVELAEDSITAVNVKRYAEIVADQYLRRTAITTLTEGIRSLECYDEDVQTVLSDIGELLDQGDDAGVQDLRQMAPGFATSVLSGTSPYPFKISTAIADLEDITDGFVPGDYVIIAAPPGHGKTAFALDLAFYRACQGDNGLYLAMDQMSRTMVQRLFSAETGLPRKALVRAFEDSMASVAVNMASERLSRLPGAIFTADRANLSMIDIRSLARSYRRKHGIKYLVMDYIQQIRGAGGRQENRTNEMTAISGQIKALGKELDIPIIALSQLSRAYDLGECDPAKDKWPRPRVTMLRDSGALEADANTIIFLMNKKKILQDRFGNDSEVFRSFMTVHGSDRFAAEIIVAKQKEGDTGSVSCLFDPIRMRFQCFSRQDRSAQEQWSESRRDMGNKRRGVEL